MLLHSLIFSDFIVFHCFVAQCKYSRLSNFQMLSFFFLFRRLDDTWISCFVNIKLFSSSSCFCVGQLAIDRTFVHCICIACGRIIVAIKYSMEKVIVGKWQSVHLVTKRDKYKCVHCAYMMLATQYVDLISSFMLNDLTFVNKSESVTNMRIAHARHCIFYVRHACVCV